MLTQPSDLMAKKLSFMKFCKRSMHFYASLILSRKDLTEKLKKIMLKMFQVSQPDEFLPKGLTFLI